MAFSNGTTFTPYMLINSASNLTSIANNLSGNYALGNSINLSGNFTPLGSTATPFTGQFNGLNNTIMGLSITNSTPNTNLGLFGVATGATIENVTLNNVSITQAADNSGTSIYIGSLVGLYDLGGLIGAMQGGMLYNSFSRVGILTSNVNVVSATNNYSARNEVGALVGGVHGSAMLSNDYSTTPVTACTSRNESKLFKLMCVVK